MTRKINTTKVVALLAVLCMITSAFVGSTLAKYTTKGEGTDVARVAKWGVEVATWDADDTNVSAFSDTYAAVATSVTSEHVVAPGTDNTTGITFGITGKPEVDVDVKFDVTVTEDVVVPAGEYLDWTTANTTDKFTLSTDYTPVQFTLTQKKVDGTDAVVVDGKTLADVKSYLEGLNGKQVANTDLGKDVFGEYTLTWNWIFDDNDKADTLLGQKASGIASDANVKTGIDFKIEITVEQVDN